PSYPLYATVAVAAVVAPTQATAAFAHRQPPLPRGGHPATGVAALDGGNPFAGAAVQAVVLTDDASARRCRPYGLLPLRATVAPCGLALVAAGHPLVGGLGRGLAMGGWPCMGAGRPSSSLPSLR
ncbi:hypothetical protein B296_00037955, partial [Ensete ventricosum]